MKRTFISCWNQLSYLKHAAFHCEKRVGKRNWQQTLRGNLSYHVLLHNSFSAESGFEPTTALSGDADVATSLASESSTSSLSTVFISSTSPECRRDSIWRQVEPTLLELRKKRILVRFWPLTVFVCH